jgi:hypothetical protein
MSVVYASVREFPSIAALVQTCLCVSMLVTLMHLKPYRHSFTYYFDVLCYLCLITQFVLEVLVQASESLGISLSSANNFSKSLDNSFKASYILRYAYTHLKRTESGKFESGKFARHFIARMHAVASQLLLQVCSVRGLLHSVDLPEACSCRSQHILCVSLPQRHRGGMLAAPEERLHVRASTPHKRSGFVLAACRETRAAQACSTC